MYVVNVLNLRGFDAVLSGMRGRDREPIGSWYHTFFWDMQNWGSLVHQAC